MKKSNEATSVSSTFKLSIISALVISLSGCLGGGTNPVVTTQSPVATGPTPATGAIAGDAPAAASVVASANSGSAVVAGTAPAITNPTLGTVGTNGIAGLAVSAPVSFNNATNTATLGVVSIPTDFALVSTGSIANNTSTGLNITAKNATTTGTVLDIQAGGLNTVTSAGGVTTASLTTAAPNSDYNIQVVQPAGYTYTQFGDWFQCSANCITGTTTEVVGWFSRGETTAPANIPTIGTATYAGSTFGTYVNAAGAVANTTSAMSLVVNFATRSVAFSTAGMTNGAANISGTLTYAAGQNLFTGTVNAAGGVGTGTAAGRFNGPAAEEMGGIYYVNGSAGAQAGSFVGKK